MKKIADLMGTLEKEFEYAISLISRCTEDYIFYFNITKDYYYIAESALNKFKFPGNYFNNAIDTIMNIVYEEDRVLLQDDVYELKNGYKSEHNLEYRWYDCNGNIVWISCRGMVMEHNENADIILVGCITEIGADKKADNITGLKMENQIYIDFNKLLEVGAVGKGSMLMIGIDNFKGINDIYGTETGDYIMRALSEHLSRLKDKDSYLYRIKGDGFLIVDYDNGSEDKSHNLYVDLRNSLDQITKALNYKAIYTISAGIVTFDKNDNVADILHKVEFSLAQAKRNGKNCSFVYNDEAYRSHIRKLDIREKMRQSVDNDFKGFELYYQPIVDSVSSKLIGAEALLRWKCKEYTDVYPNEFIPILEESYLMIVVGKWVFNTAIRQCKEWQKIIPGFKININLSYIQIKKSNVIDDILQCINETGIDSNTVVFELTESQYIESDEKIRRLIAAFREHGIQLAIDDFGTGYSNFTLLHNLKVNTLKLDREVVMKAHQTEYNFKLMGNVVNMAHNVNLKVCFEGIETEDEKERLAILQPDYIQGYLYGRPVDTMTFSEQFLLQDRNKNHERIFGMEKAYGDESEESIFKDITINESLASYKLKTVLKHLNMSSFDYDIQNDIIYVAKDSVRLHDFTPYWFKDGGDYYYLENLTGKMKELIRTTFLDTTIQDLERVKNNTSGEMISFDSPIVYSSGNTRWANFVLDTVTDHNGKPVHAIGYCKDIHEQKKELFRLRNIAQTDSLTGFRNRASGQFRIETKLAEEKESTYFIAVIDLDKFKDANDLFGHSFGDIVLKNVADRIRDFFDHETICCRTGGDEFLFFRKCEDSNSAGEYLQKLKKHVEHVAANQGSKFDVKCSIGYSVYPTQGTAYEELYNKADIAMYYAKNNATGVPALYEDTMESIRK